MGNMEPGCGIWSLNMEPGEPECGIWSLGVEYGEYGA